MKLKHLLPALVLGMTPNVYAQQSVHVQPVPQDMKVTGKSVLLPTVYWASGLQEADVYAVRALKNLLVNRQEKQNSAYHVVIGERGDKSVKSYEHLIPNRPEGYYLYADDKNLILAGNDEQGTYYAVQTLAQLLRNDSLPAVTITDYPDIRYRGVVEGYYGVPWSFEDRMRQFDFYGKYKMNTYIYGPKDDPYHSSPNWRKPYPEKEAENIRRLVEAARQQKVDFVWAIHPGLDIKWTDEDRDLLLDKFQHMYDLGVRSFAVFFDDISGEGTNPQKQAELLNYIDDHFVKVKKDVTPLIMCPTEYNKSWSRPEKGYLTTLGDKLNPTIQIMWTGDRVVTDITKGTLEWVNPKLKRPAYIWWNYPVTDFSRDHLVMGEVYGMDKTITPDEMSGFVSNPMEHAEASKIALFGVASYTWNMQDYDSRQSWADALKDLMPQSTAALRVFAEHNADLGENGHKYRRFESVEIKPTVDRFMESYQQGHWNETDMQKISAEYQRMVEAADVLLASQDNPALVNDIKPWIMQFRLLGEMGQEVLVMASAMEREDQAVFQHKHARVLELLEQTIAISRKYNQNKYQPGVRTGSRVMAPLMNEVFRMAVEKYNNKYCQDLRSDITYDMKQFKGTMEEAVSK